MRIFEFDDIEEHIYHDGIVSTAKCAVWGEFPEEETELSGLRYFDMIFSPRPECDDGSYLPKLEEYSLLDFSITKSDGRYEVTMNCIDDGRGRNDFSHLHFFCDEISVMLSRYEKLSYKNIFSDDMPSAEERNYLKDECHLSSEKYVLGDGITVIYDFYGEDDGSHYIYSTAKIARCSYFKDGIKFFEHLCDRYHLRPAKELIHHANGHSYLPYHVDLYGLSILEIDTGRHYDYVPEGMEHDFRFSAGESFIVTDVHYDPESSLLVCEGCCWACPDEVMVMDFSEPLHYDPRMVKLHDEIPMDYDEYDDIEFLRREKDSLIVKGEDGNEYAVTKKRLLEMLSEKRKEYPSEEFDK